MEIVQEQQSDDTEIVQEGVQHHEDMEIEHDTATKEPMTLNLVVETTTMELK